MKKAKDLSKYERQEFTEHFYDLWPCEDDDLVLGNSNPWGCPWYWSDEELEGNSIKEMAQNFFKKHEKHLLELIKGEKE